MRWNMLPKLASILAVASACVDDATAPQIRPLPNPDVARVVWADSAVGETGPGSLYALYKPTNWNGDAVFYAHGFVDAAAPVALPTTQDSANVLRDALGAMGYAVAMSSYSSNGYDFEDGLRRTHQLKGLLTSRFGRPERSYLAGHSLGGQIGLGLAERYRGQYDGALLMCGVLGGSEAHFTWLGNVRVLFDFFYPGVLPGDVRSVPAGTTPNDIINRALPAIMANPGPVFVIAAIDQTPLAGRNPNEIINSLVYALVWHARGINDVTDRAQGHLPYGNAGIVFTDAAPAFLPLPPVSASLLGAINAMVPRYEATPDAAAWVARNFEPSGVLHFPVLTLHTLHDQAVPFFHETIFGGLVAQAGSSAFLVQRTVNTYGHCNFTQGEVLTAFGDLVNWVTTGVAPTP
jgi:pimeloyl-ACP methyl ester carboxylesterase